MADFEWIKKTVNTEGRPCPHRLGERCPGERSGCAFWIDEVLVSDGKTRQLAGCLHAFAYVMNHEVVLESVRTQAAINQASNSTKQAGDALVAAVATHRALIGGRA